MRKFLLVATIAMVLFLPVVELVQAVDVLNVNFGIEQGLKNWIVAGSGKASLDETDKWKDAGSVMMDASGGMAQVQTRVPAKVQKGRYYFFDLTDKGKDAKIAPSIGWSIKDTGGSIFVQSMWNGLIPMGNGTFDWRQESIPVMVPESAAGDSADFSGIMYCQAGTRWVADIRLREAGKLIRGCEYKLEAEPVKSEEAAPAKNWLEDGFFFHCSQNGKNVKPERLYKGLEKGIKLTIEMPSEERVDKVMAFCARPNSNHILDRVELYYYKFGERIKAGETMGYSGKKEYSYSIPEIKLGQKTSKIELVFWGKGYLVLSEIGLLQENKTGGAAEAATLKESPVIENEYVRLSFAPGQGGVCKSMVYKPTGSELVYGEETGYGLFRDRFWGPNYSFGGVSYDYEISKGPKSQSISMKAMGSAGIFSFTSIKKTVTVEKGNPLVKVAYEVINDPASFATYNYGLWIHNFFGGMSGRNTYYCPTSSGVKEYPHDPTQKKSDDIWIKDPVRGWMGFVNSTGVGAACAMDYKPLNLMYMWLGKTPVPTFEWRYNRVATPSGETLKTTFYIFPFKGLPRLDGCFDGMAGALILPERVSGSTVQPELLVVSDTDRTVEVEVSARPVAQEKWAPAGKVQAQLKKDTVNKIKLPTVNNINGESAVICRVTSGGKFTGDFERAFNQGTEASGKYARLPVEKQIGEREEVGENTGRARHELSMDVVTPHVPWAKPFAGGRVKALVLTDNTAIREIVELAQRMDLDADTVKFCFGDNYLWYGDESIKSEAEARVRLKEKLDKKWDVFVIAGIDWERQMGKENIDKILSQVKSGTGLVLVGPVGMPDELASAIGASKTALHGGMANIGIVKDHYITKGIPWQHMPQVRALKYDNLADDNATLAKLAGKSVLKTASLGDGRVTAWFYDVFYNTVTPKEKFTGYNFSRITPMTSGSSKVIKEMPVTWPYWEYWYSMMIRSMLWSAKKDGGTAIESMIYDASGLSVKLASPQKAQLEIVWRNSYGDEISRERADINQPSGEVKAKANSSMQPGLNFADIRLLSGSGAVLDWGTLAVDYKPMLSIKGISTATEIVPEGSPREISGSVEIAGTPAAGTQLRIRAYDYYGRLLSEKNFPAKEGAVPYTLSVANLLTMPVQLEADLVKDGRVLDVSKKEVFFARRDNWDPLRYRHCTWYISPITSPIAPPSEFSMDQLAKAAEEKGFTNYIYGANAIRPIYKLNAAFTPINVGNFSSVDYLARKDKWIKTGDAQWLVREPSLTDPAYKKKAADYLQSVVRSTVDVGGGPDYVLADELDLTHYGDYYDFDFSPSSIEGFREWLKKGYGSISALNSEWGTSYNDWNRIEPMLLSDARKRTDGNYSPWADFRTYMDDATAGFVGFLQGKAQEVDSKARLSISGTQNAEAGNGMDWWKMANNLKMIHAYDQGYTLRMLFHYSRRVDTLVAPYQAGVLRINPELEYNVWRDVVNGAFAGSSWSMPTFYFTDLTLNPSGKDLSYLMNELHAGVWPVMRLAKPEKPKVGIVYSHPSIQAAFITGRQKEYNAFNNAWMQVLDNMGIPFEYVSYAELDDPAFLAKQGYSVLILPEMLAMSKKQAESIRRFTSSGGMLVSDVRPGIMDEHCRTLQKGQLDDLFGLRFAGEETKRTDLTVSADLDAFKAGTSIKGLYTCAAAEGGIPLMKSPDGRGAFYVKQAGKGEAMLTNIRMDYYTDVNKMGGPVDDTYRSLVLSLLARAGIKPSFAVKGAEGKSFAGQIASFTDGDRTYLAFRRRPDTAGVAQVFTVTLPKAFSVYDVRKKTYLGQSKDMNVVFTPRESVKLFCLTEKPKSGVMLNVPGESKRGSNALLKIQLASKAAHNTVFRVEVKSPDGKVVRHYSGVAILKSGEAAAEFAVPFALNDTPGKWGVRIYDVACPDATAEKSVILK